MFSARRTSTSFSRLASSRCAPLSSVCATMVMRAISSFSVGPTENEEIARMTIVAHTDERGAHRLEASLEKLVDVLLAENISGRALLERDLALIKVSADQQNRPHLMELIKVFRARVVDVAPESLIIEVSGAVDKIDGLLEVLRPFGVLEMARTGRISMTRGGDLLRPPVPESTASELESTGSGVK